LTQKIAPKRPWPAVTASIATKLMRALASLSQIAAHAPALSVPCARNTVFFLLTLMPSLRAAAMNLETSWGMKSTCARPALGKPVNARRLTPCAASALSIRAPWPARLGVFMLK
jgi:hypothetical protein